MRPPGNKSPVNSRPPSPTIQQGHGDIAPSVVVGPPAAIVNGDRNNAQARNLSLNLPGSMVSSSRSESSPKSLHRRLSEESLARKPSMTYKGQTYTQDKIFRDASQARDSVYLVRGADGLSIIKSGPDLAEEARITEKVSGHENVVQLLDKENDNSQFRLEYATQGRLDKFEVGKENARTLMRGIVNGLDYVHGKGVAHCDLGEANILVGGTQASPIAKISDFGQSMDEPEKVRLHIASDIAGGGQLLNSILRKSGLPEPQELTDLRNSAQTLVKKSTLAAPLDDEQKELLILCGESIERGPPPTEQEITTLRTKWTALLNTDLLKE